eukprot:9548362-Heterocapsa_arctica.AAC.1
MADVLAARTTSAQLQLLDAHALVVLALALALALAGFRRKPARLPRLVDVLTDLRVAGVAVGG